jgi:hypothetical protein
MWRDRDSIFGLFRDPKLHHVSLDRRAELRLFRANVRHAFSEAVRRYSRGGVASGTVISGCGEIVSWRISDCHREPGATSVVAAISATLRPSCRQHLLSGVVG